MRSDVGESDYTMLKNKKGIIKAIVFQTTLNEKVRSSRKSLWERTLHVLDSISETNVDVQNKVKRSYYKLEFVKNLTDKTSIDSNDRCSLLTSQLKCMMNMIACDETNMLPDEENIDIFSPMESLNGQCMVEFHLGNLDLISNVIKKQKEADFQLQNSIIQDFCKG